MESTQCSKVSVDMKDLSSEFLLSAFKTGYKNYKKLYSELELMEAELRARGFGDEMEVD